MGVCTIERAFDIFYPASCTYIFSEVANVRSPQVRHRTHVLFHTKHLGMNKVHSRTPIRTQNSRTHVLSWARRTVTVNAPSNDGGLVMGKNFF